jgi:hypothetical protein
MLEYSSTEAGEFQSLARVFVPNCSMPKFLGLANQSDKKRDKNKIGSVQSYQESRITFSGNWRMLMEVMSSRRCLARDANNEDCLHGSSTCKLHDRVSLARIRRPAIVIGSDNSL